MFSMEDSRDAFKIPHDLKIFREVFSCERATRENDFWKAYDLPKVSFTTIDSGNMWDLEKVQLRVSSALHMYYWKVSCGQIA